MLFILFQTAAIGGTAGLLLYARARMHRRSAQSWDELVARLQPDLNAGRFAGALPAAATPEERWERVNGAAGLCAMFKNAKVMLEIADFACRNGEQANPLTIAALRSDALHIRVLVVAALAEYAFTQLNEGIVANAQRASDMYRQMLESTAELLEASLAMPAPQYAAIRSF